MHPYRLKPSPFNLAHFRHKNTLSVCYYILYHRIINLLNIFAPPLKCRYQIFLSNRYMLQTFSKFFIDKKRYTHCVQENRRYQVGKKDVAVTAVRSVKCKRFFLWFKDCLHIIGRFLIKRKIHHQDSDWFTYKYFHDFQF